jgi:hypothetical protein
VGRDNALKYSNPLNPYMPINVPVSTLKGKWNPDVNEPRPPVDLSVDPFSGCATENSLCAGCSFCCPLGNGRPAIVSECAPVLSGL